MKKAIHYTRWLRVAVTVATAIIILTSSSMVGAASRSIRDSSGATAPAPAAPAAPPVDLSRDRSLRGSGEAAAPQADAPTAPAYESPTSSGPCRDGEEWAMLGLINNYRAANGLTPLQMSQTLSNAAENHSADMASLNYFGHTLSNGASWADNVWTFGYTFDTSLAENIAAGNASAAETFQQWLNSPGHNANMLNPNVTAIGVGRASSGVSDFGTYWTTTFGGVVDAGAC